jgi:endonuclease/exonuclease/phosphatase family metal-dependent hydrolase
VVYRVGDTTQPAVRQFCQFLSREIGPNLNNPAFIVGDLNLTDINWSSFTIKSETENSQEHEHFRKFVGNYFKPLEETTQTARHQVFDSFASFEQLVKNVTYVPRPSILDLILTNRPDLISDVKVGGDDKLDSDHLPVYFKLNTRDTYQATSAEDAQETINRTDGETSKTGEETGTTHASNSTSYSQSKGPQDTSNRETNTPQASSEVGSKSADEAARAKANADISAGKNKQPTLPSPDTAASDDNPKELWCVLWNAHSLTETRFGHLSKLLTSSSVNCALVCETCFKWKQETETKQLVQTINDKYRFIHADRINDGAKKASGGVCVFIRKDFIVTNSEYKSVVLQLPRKGKGRPLAISSKVELIRFEFKSQDGPEAGDGKTYRFIVVYRVGAATQTAVSQFCQFLSREIGPNLNNPAFIVGDLNLPGIDWSSFTIKSSTQKSQEHDQFRESGGNNSEPLKESSQRARREDFDKIASFELLAKIVTYVRCPSILDLILTNRPDLISDVKDGGDDKLDSHHLPVYFKLNTRDTHQGASAHH